MKVCKLTQFQIWVGARGEMCLRDISSRQNECLRVVIFMCLCFIPVKLKLNY